MSMVGARNLVIGCCMVMIHAYSYSQELWTIGPMLHLRLDGVKKNNSFSIEAAYWNINSFIYSVDVGIEFEHGRTRLYTEGQTGIGLTGISMGPVVEFNSKATGGTTNLGVQGSCWINYFVGFDYRVRLIGGEKVHYTGAYVKLPFATSGLDEDGDGSSWDDWDDWD